MIPTDLKEFHGIYHFHCLSLNNKSNVFIQIILVKQCAYNLDPVAERVRILPREKTKQPDYHGLLKNLPIKYQDMEEIFFSALECIYFGLEIRLDSFDNF